MLSIRNIRIHYGVMEAVSGVSMEIAQGCIISLLGANGSGKSTIFKAISGLKQITSGEIWLNNQRIDNIPAHNRVNLGLAHVPEGKGLFPFMSVMENLRMGAFLRRDKAEIKQNIDGLVKSPTSEI
ncbi:ATP-binding cassette domain-containing protein [Thermodesulfobacteriota bacterium]